MLVTGANGFVGRALCESAAAKLGRVTGVTRKPCCWNANVENVIVGTLDDAADWRNVLNGCDVVVHLAARVHVMHDTSSNPLAEFRKVNVAGTEHLARSAAAAGVKRLVYVSSIKVNGEQTRFGEPYTETSLPAPQDPYGVSKWEAEQALHKVAEETGLEVVIVRPPLIYGSEVKGNFARMLKVLHKGMPLPLASVHNLRSLVYVQNFADALLACATHPAAAGQTYLVSDGEDVSTPELLRVLGAAMGHSARLFAVPPSLLQWGGALLGKSDQLSRLLGSLQVDSGKIRRELNWTPPYSLQQGLQATAEWYRSTHP